MFSTFLQIYSDNVYSYAANLCSASQLCNSLRLSIPFWIVIRFLLYTFVEAYGRKCYKLKEEAHVTIRGKYVFFTSFSNAT